MFNDFQANSADINARLIPLEMTHLESKLRPMKIYSAVEQAILDSIKRGDPDRLSNKGQRIDLSEWQRTPEHLRMGNTVLKNAGIKPHEIELKDQIATLKAAIKRLDKEKDKVERTELVNKLNSLMVTHQLRMERLNRR